MLESRYIEALILYKHRNNLDDKGLAVKLDTSVNVVRDILRNRRKLYKFTTLKTIMDIAAEVSES